MGPMITRRLFPVLCMALLLATSACGSSIPFLSTRTPTPTGTPIPTLTPSLTPTATRTPEPTKELRPGIDTPVELGGNLSLLFIDLKITGDYYNPEIYDEHVRIFPGVGQTALVMEGQYEGEMRSFFSPDIVTPLLKDHFFYVESPKSRHEYAFDALWSGSAKHLFAIYFIINIGDNGPFKLHDNVHGWVVDLASLPILPTETATPTFPLTPLPTNTP